MKGNVLVILLAIVALAGAGAAGYFFWQNQQLKQENSSPIPFSNPPASPSAVTPTPVNQEQPTNPNAKTFTSTNLGISFNYTALPISGTEMVQVKESGDKVYVYPSSYQDYTKGQWVEVFSKASTDSLATAVKKRFLTNYSAADCLVTSPADIGQNHYPVNYQTATIDVPKSANDDMSTLSEKWAKCPEPYVSENGISYFLEDTNHPDKFVYFSIGQYGIDSGIPNLPWQETIKFQD